MSSPIWLGGEDIEYVEEFCYLGSVISTDRGTDKDISVRTGKNRYAFRALQPVWFVSFWIWPFSPSGRYKSKCSKLFIFP